MADSSWALRVQTGSLLGDLCFQMPKAAVDQNKKQKAKRGEKKRTPPPKKKGMRVYEIPGVIIIFSDRTYQ